MNNIVGEAFRVAYAQQRLGLLSEQMRNVVLSPKMTTPAISSVFQTEKFHPSTRTADPRQQALAPFLSSTEMTNGSNSHPAVPKHPRFAFTSQSNLEAVFLLIIFLFSHQVSTKSSPFNIHILFHIFSYFVSSALMNSQLLFMIPSPMILTINWHVVITRTLRSSFRSLMELLPHFFYIEEIQSFFLRNTG